MIRSKEDVTMDVMTKRVFISYSWAKQEYVTDIVERLRHDGIDTVFDQYDLIVGDDVYQFMERAVNDKSIDYVLMFCDETYTEKANSHGGGVGTETQIISPGLYKNNDPGRFIPIVIEKDENGNPYLPTFLRSRKYIDLCCDNNEGYMELVRHIYERPLKRKPALGLPPSFLNNEDDERLWPLREHVKQIRQTDAPKLNDEFIDIAVDVLISVIGSEPVEINQMRSVLDKELPVRDLVLEYLLCMMNKHVPTGQIVTEIIERLQNKKSLWPRETTSREIVGFFIWELMLDYITLCVQKKRFTDMSEVVTQLYYVKDDGRYPDGLIDFNFIYRHFELLDKTRDEEEKRYLSFQSELLTHRGFSNIINTQTLSESDIILYHISILNQTERRWFPESYVYHKGREIEIWSRMESKRFCESILCLFDVESIDELRIKIIETKQPTMVMHKWAYQEAPWITESIIPENIGKRI